MPTIAQKSSLAKLPQHELTESLRVFLRPLTALLPDIRLPAVAELMVQGTFILCPRCARSRAKPCRTGHAANHL